MKEEEIFLQRHVQLLELNFVIDDSHPIKVYNHPDGMWIADFALEQYHEKEWAGFIKDFNQSLLHL